MNTKILSLLLSLAVIGSFTSYYLSEPAQSLERTLNLENSDLFKYLNLDELNFRISLFQEWTTKYNKNYGLSETAQRFAAWNKNYEFVQEHNAKNLSFTVEMNLFADLTSEEFGSLYLGFDGANYVHDLSTVELLEESNLEGSFDWRNQGAVTDIKNQGQCGDCYAFSSIQALEGLHKIKKGTLPNFSAQQICDCSSSYGNNGCNGGLMTNSFKYTQNYGIETSDNYPERQQVQSCRYSSSKAGFKNTGYRSVGQSASQLKAAVKNQPVSVGIEADQSAFQMYKSGVISSGCGTNLDHAVLVVGYSDSKYWIVKNQWGSSWGLSGYVHIAQGSQNGGAGVCGINSAAVYPTL